MRLCGRACMLLVWSNLGSDGTAAGAGEAVAVEAAAIRLVGEGGRGREVSLGTLESPILMGT